MIRAVAQNRLRMVGVQNRSKNLGKSASKRCSRRACRQSRFRHDFGTKIDQKSMKIDPDRAKIDPDRLPGRLDRPPRATVGARSGSIAQLERPKSTRVGSVAPPGSPRGRSGPRMRCNHSRFPQSPYANSGIDNMIYIYLGLYLSRSIIRSISI